MHKKLISSLSLISILMTPIYAHANPNLNDIYGHWAKKEINQFISSGYVNGYEDGTFRPDSSITRAEFVKLVNKYFGFNNKEDIKFSDINTNDWYYKDICIASKAGYINGYEDKTFKPNKTITREEVSKILISIKNKQDNVYDKLNKYPDKNKVSNWAKPYVEGAIEQGYLKGNDLGLLNPTNNITRAESVTILSRVVKEKPAIKKEVKNEAPVITAKEHLILEVGQKFDISMLNVKVSDKEDKDLDIKYEGKVNTDLPGDYTITITATDSKGLTTTKKVTVVVKAKPEVKNEPPVITAKDLTIKQGDKFEYSMLNAQAKDTNGKNISNSIIYSGNVNTSKAGEYPITLTAKDEKGTTNSLKVKVIVKSINKLPIDNQNKLLLQKILDDKTSNVKVHKDDHGTIESYDVFSKGVNPPSDSDYTILKESGYTIPVAPYKPGMGWYDANKVFSGAGDDSLCSGATAANMLNWWMDQNSDYIDKYLDLHGENSTCINKELGISQNATISNFRKNPDDLFKYITKCFGNRDNKGIAPDRTLFWFLNGHDLNYRLPVNKTDSRGGFFQDVFNDYNSIIGHTISSYFSDLNYSLLDNLYHNQGIGISYHTPFGGASHIVSLWGAKFDTNGNLLGVFVTDSNDGKTLIDNKSGNTYGMVYMNVVKEVNTGKARLTNKVTPNGNIGAPVLDLYTLDTGKSIWEDYFKSINSKS
ncbi:glucan endo-1 [[Clostridium] sordellii]|uniref:IdeS/Mac family cysteine endopeptidase n=1 Tax=Paraclostridium sordellii TaxID=1505 RepID=UPI0005DEEFF6|nr:IdeS/Mac family cysteine endopeptidase [Paeniclostridium sordellii]MDU1453469.1 IdeS/Mac family cysteine endopeptidase [Paeniclostridium sordellii]CEQ30586.1 glucan endo-1 [[Clostridium] sordellii] [Paeniclostridium sordellii]